jgi:hypothetical protein
MPPSTQLLHEHGRAYGDFCERIGVCTENSILVAYVTESPNVSGDDRSLMLLPDPVRLVVQVKDPT